MKGLALYKWGHDIYKKSGDRHHVKGDGHHVKGDGHHVRGDGINVLRAYIMYKGGTDIHIFISIYKARLCVRVCVCGCVPLKF